MTHLTSLRYGYLLFFFCFAQFLFFHNSGEEEATNLDQDWNFNSRHKGNHDIHSGQGNQWWTRVRGAMSGREQRVAFWKASVAAYGTDKPYGGEVITGRQMYSSASFIRWTTR